MGKSPPRHCELSPRVCNFESGVFPLRFGCGITCRLSRGRIFSCFWNKKLVLRSLRLYMVEILIVRACELFCWISLTWFWGLFPLHLVTLKISSWRFRLRNSSESSWTFGPRVWRSWQAPACARPYPMKIGYKLCPWTPRYYGGCGPRRSIVGLGLDRCDLNIYVVSLFIFVFCEHAF